MTDETSPDLDPALQTDDDAGSSKPRLTDAQFAEIREHYELGTKTMAELAAEFNVARQTLSRRFKDAGVVKGSRAHELQAAVKKGVVQGAQGAAQPIGERYIDKRMEWIEETRVNGYKTINMIRNLQLKRLRDAVQAGTAFAAVDDDMKALVRLQKNLIEGYDFQLDRILNANDIIDEDALPDLSIQDLTEEDLVKHHIDIADAGVTEDDIRSDVSKMLEEQKQAFK
jgi:AraC-like DNA-binding protein